MKIVITLCIIAYISLGSAYAITLKEFQQTLQNGNRESIAESFQQVLHSGSPELIMRARGALLHYLPSSAERDTMLKQCLDTTLTLTPNNLKQGMWLANAQYIKAGTLPAGEEKFNLLKSATLLGHDKAPADMAMIIAQKQPKNAQDLLKLSLLRGNYGAAITYVKLENSPSKKAELIRILEGMAAKGDTKAKRTLKELKKE